MSNWKNLLFGVLLESPPVISNPRAVGVGSQIESQGSGDPESLNVAHPSEKGDAVGGCNVIQARSAKHRRDWNNFTNLHPTKSRKQVEGNRWGGRSLGSCLKAAMRSTI